MALAFADALTSLNTVIGDSDDVTFTSGEKTRALTKAWNDPFVVNIVWDSSLTYTTGTYQYTLPATLTTLKDIYIARTGTSNPFPEPIDNSLWELINGKIQFQQQADWLVPNGYVLYLKGNYKLTTSDSITPIDLQEYVLSLAGVETLKLLAHKKVNRFLKNDTTIPEIIGLRRELQNEVVDLRRKLQREWESA